MARPRSLRSSAAQPTSRSIAAALILALCTPMAALTAQASIRATNRNYSTDRQALDVGGRFDSWLKSADITQAASPTGPTAQVVMTSAIPGPGLTGLIRAMLRRDRSFALSTREMNGAPAGMVQIETFDNQYQAISVLALLRPAIAQVQLPTMDGGSKDAIVITTRFFPAPSQSTNVSKAPPASMAGLIGAHASLLSNFALRIDGIDCSMVAKVELPTITAQRPDAPPTFTPVVVHISPNHAAPFQQWLAAGGTKNGTLTILTPDMVTPLYVVKLAGLHIQTIVNATEVGSQAIPRSVITMSVGGMDVGVP